MFLGLLDSPSGPCPGFPGLPFGRLSVGNPSSLPFQHMGQLLFRAPPSRRVPVSRAVLSSLDPTRPWPSRGSGLDCRTWVVGGAEGSTHVPFPLPTAPKSLFFVPGRQEAAGVNEAICALKGP